MNEHRNLRQLESGTNELQGYVDMGMKREALKLARITLKQTNIAGKDFGDALNAILIHADKWKSWTPVIQTAYARLSKQDKQAARRWMLSYYYASKNYEAAVNFIPPRFVGKFDLTELAFTCEIWLQLKRMDEMDKLAKKLSRAIGQAAYPVMQRKLAECLAKYYTRKGLWNKAVELWEFVRLDNIFCESAVESIVDIHVAGALLAIKRGLELVENFNENPDPKMETTLPGNDKELQQLAEKKFRKLKKILEKIVPEKHYKELGLDAWPKSADNR